MDESDQSRNGSMAQALNHSVLVLLYKPKELLRTVALLLNIRENCPEQAAQHRGDKGRVIPSYHQFEHVLWDFWISWKEDVILSVLLLT